MTCQLCRQRKARRHCPALGHSICTICCGTKRLVEISCPADCVHLVAAREHPAATVRRRQEQDVAQLEPTVRHLTGRQQQLFFLFHAVIARHTPDGFARLLDADVADAAASLAGTLETAARGVIYEHDAQSSVARKLVAEFKDLLDEVRRHGTRVFDGETAITLRAIEAGARQAGGGGNGTAYQELVGRLLQVPAKTGAGVASASSPLILPPT